MTATARIIAHSRNPDGSDHTASLVWVTPNAEQLIGDIARVSNPAGQGGDPASLIGYLIRHKHWSPFEMVNMCVEVNTTRTMGRQYLRQSPRPQEFSQRYAEPSDLGAMIYSRARVQDEKNRQASHPATDLELIQWWDDVQAEVEAFISARYREARQRNIAKEQARNILPEGMTPTKMYFQGNLRDWLFTVQTRGGNGTQPEALEIAHKIRAIIYQEFPVTAAAFFEGDAA